MTDIRPIREAEADDFLQLLCDVFKLDFDRAHPIFFREPLFDLNRKWALFEGPDMVSILTTTPLEFGWGRAIGIAGVATRASRRQEGFAAQLIRRVLRESERAGEGPALLFAVDERLYETLGFEKIDRVIRARVVADPDAPRGRNLSHTEIRRIYDEWSSRHPDRLRRDDRRWQYWQYHLRLTEAFGAGYICSENQLVREAIYSNPVEALPLDPGTEWYGTTFMTDQLGLEVTDIQVETYLMGYKIPGIPQLYMTDQF